MKTINECDNIIESNEDESRINNFVLDLPEGKQGTTKCILDFKIYSSAGCPKSFLSKIFPHINFKI